MVCRLQSASPAWRVTSPWRPVRPTAALAIQVTRGILSMGWASRSVDHVSNPTLGVHPLARSRCQGLVLEIVNLNATSSGQFGTIPSMDSTGIARLAQGWGRVVARRVEEQVGPDLDLDADQIEQFAK